MPRPERFFDWRQLLAADARPPVVVDSCRRLRWMFAALVLAVAVVMARAAWLEVTRGPAFRYLAAQPILRQVSLPARRGQILAADGTLFAHERQVAAAALHYRYLEEPPNAQWLVDTARRRLTVRERKDPQRMQAEVDRVRGERSALHERLADLAGLSLDELNAARARVQVRVERIAQSVNARHQARLARQKEAAAKEKSSPDNASLPMRAARYLKETLFTSVSPLPSGPIVVAEELDYHVVAEGLPAAAIAEIESDPDRFAGLKIVQQTRRAYPQGALAAHLVGHLGAASPRELDESDAYREGDRIGRMGLERHYETLLRGRRGLEVERVDFRGRAISRRVERPATPGGDLVLTVDPRLQQSAERLLDDALQRRLLRSGDDAPTSGGAIVVMDCNSGAVLAAASAPRFDPNVVESGASGPIGKLLAAPDQPLFDRTAKMALPPGSVMKTISAVGLLASGAVDPQATFHCRGYLHQPDRQRCYIYTRFGVGHDDLTLEGALAESCNVYFFHYAARLGSESLVEWFRQFGLGEPTGVDLPDEASGHVPPPDLTLSPVRRDVETGALAIGQSSLTVTPLQLARAMAAVANGGRLVAPHVVARDDARTGGRTIEGLSPGILETVRRGLERAVSDRGGTAHSTLSFSPVPIAAKTGTAETAEDEAAHAWLCGYAPSDAPQIVFVVVLEHAGGGASAAGPVANRLIARMHELGYFTSRAAIAGRPRTPR